MFVVLAPSERSSSTVWMKETEKKSLGEKLVRLLRLLVEGFSEKMAIKFRLKAHRGMTYG